LWPQPARSPRQAPTRFQQPLKRTARIASIRNGAAHDNVVAPDESASRGRGDTLLVIERLAGEADPGTDDLELRI